MPAIGGIHDAVSSSMVDAWQPANLILTICSVLCMVTVVSLCTCCQKKVKNRDPEDVYGIVNPAAVTITSGEGPSSNNPHSVQFRSLSKGAKINERHSQPSGKNGSSIHNSTRVSAPGRALPQLPADMYTAIDKQRGGRKDEISFADDNCNPTYESIDPEVDSIIDPLYSKVGEVRTSRRERKYDYPIFPGRKRTDGQGPSQPEETLYQSASQIYAGASEDPYSSITSDSRVVANSGDGDSSSAYDPGYAKVKPNGIDSKRLDRLEKTERELDQLYSKIRRTSRDIPSSQLPPSAGPSRITMDDVIGPPGGGDGTSNDPMLEIQPPQIDSQSVSSRDPSYRYITVRESAEIVRERLRQQGELLERPPVREHYYSTIGNEYETVGDGSSTTYSQVQVNGNSADRTPAPAQAVPVRPTGLGALTVSTATRDYVPPPPTSPIPDRTSAAARTEPATVTHTTIGHGSTVPHTSGGHGSSVTHPFSVGHGNTVTLTSGSHGSTVPENNVLPSSPYRTARQDTVERVEPVAGATYAVVSKGKPANQTTVVGGASQRQLTTTFGASPSQSNDPPAGTTISLNSDWNAASLSTATSFAGLHRSFSPNSSGVHSPPAGSSNRASTSPMATVQGIQEFMQRPVLPYVAPGGETVIGRKVTEEKETVIENRHSAVAGSPESHIDLALRGVTHNRNTISPVRSPGQPGSDSVVRVDPSPERVHHVEIRRDGPSADNIISGRRYRTGSHSQTTSGSSLDLGLSLNFNQQAGQPGPSSPSGYSTSMHSTPDTDANQDSDGHTSRSRYSSRSGLPLPLNGDDVRKMAERSKQRRQESLEREEQERAARESARSSGKTTARSRERRKPWKEETEEEKIQRLGTIYTGKDYVSTIDMGTSRPWPIMGSSSPPSLRKDNMTSRGGLFGGAREEDNNNDKAARQGDESVSCEGAGDELASCQDPACFCHGNTPRSTVIHGNRAEMEKINWGQPID